MKQIIIKLAIVAVTLLALVGAFNKIGHLREENIRLKHNQEILLAENQIIMAESQKYKVADSLSAARVSELELTLKEYARHRSQDLKLIEQLKTGKSDLQKVVASQSETILDLSAKLKDSVQIDTIAGRVNILKYFDYKSKWTDVMGCINLEADTINLHINNRESIKVVETITRRRFLGFLWRTNKVKSRQVDVVSENPNTEIVNCEYISIKQ